ncbi:MAG TPA: YicC/YloC family endoribonuclease [Bryobacteraceae bacterium]|nr:YicC/YloC family endoribonuclease [Bryobacteraceae bacterium]
MPLPLRSMTGFARVRRALGDGELVVSVKSVNHRGLDLHIQAPSAVDPYEGLIRGQVKEAVVRGHVEVRVSLPKSAAGGGITVNREFLREYLRIFNAEAEAHGIETRPDLNAALRIPGMLVESEEPSLAEETEALLKSALAEALASLNQFREREGEQLGAELRGHNARVAAAAIELEQLRVGAAEAFQKRLDGRLKELLAGAAVEPQRLAQEAAILADRSDIGEELARLKIHSGEVGQLVEGGGEIGKKLDFLLQEMNRETNTVLSKTNGAGEAAMKITALALEVKAAIEKIREQSLNLE